MEFLFPASINIKRHDKGDLTKEDPATSRPSELVSYFVFWSNVDKLSSLKIPKFQRPIVLANIEANSFLDALEINLELDLIDEMLLCVFGQMFF